MSDINERRICIKFRFKLDKNTADTNRTLQQASDDQALSQGTTLERLIRFKVSREFIGVDERSVRPPSSTIPEIRETTPQDFQQKCILILL